MKAALRFRFGALLLAAALLCACAGCGAGAAGAAGADGRETVRISMYNDVCYPAWRACVEAQCPDVDIRWENNRNTIANVLYQAKHGDMILVNIPTVEEQSERELYSTIPLSILLTPEALITVCSEETPVIRSFEQGKVRDFRTQMKSRFVLQMLYRIDTLYLQYLRNVDRKSEEVETQLHKSTQNRELIELLKLEKSLVYFTTALRSNEAVLEKLLRTELIKKYPEDAELLEDVIVENKQAIEMANIYSGILSGMDAPGNKKGRSLKLPPKFVYFTKIFLTSLV